jgi:hypothetical protein
VIQRTRFRATSSIPVARESEVNKTTQPAAVEMAKLTFTSPANNKSTARGRANAHVVPAASPTAA